MGFNPTTFYGLTWESGGGRRPMVFKIGGEEKRLQRTLSMKPGNTPNSLLFTVRLFILFFFIRKHTQFPYHIPQTLHILSVPELIPLPPTKACPPSFKHYIKLHEEQ